MATAVANTPVNSMAKIVPEDQTILAGSNAVASANQQVAARNRAQMEIWSSVDNWASPVRAAWPNTMIWTANTTAQAMVRASPKLGVCH